MSVLRNGWLRMACMALAGWSLLGCQSQPELEEAYYRDADTIIKDVERDQMLHRNASLDLKGMLFVPIDQDFNISGGASGKFEMEAQKNLYFGVELGYHDVDVDETANDALAAFNANDPRATAAAASLDPEQWMESFKRWDILFCFDYDIPLLDPAGGWAPSFRFGLGLGAVIVEGEAVEDGTFADDVDSRLFAQFLARPSVGLRIPIIDALGFFLEASYDYIPADKLTVDGALFNNTRTKIDGDVDFGGLNLGGGLMFTW